VIKSVKASSPGKILLTGGFSVNFGHPAICCAVNPRAYCVMTPRKDSKIRLKSSKRESVTNWSDTFELAEKVSKWNEEHNHHELAALAKTDFFAPQKHILGYFATHVLDKSCDDGLDITISSKIPIASGMGSGGAVATALSQAIYRAFGYKPRLEQVGLLAIQGDVISHGGLASGVDTWTEAMGGFINYTKQNGPIQLKVKGNIPTLIIADTGKRELSGRVVEIVQKNVEENYKFLLFDELGIIAKLMIESNKDNDWEQSGKLLYLSQIIYEKLGVSCEEIEVLVNTMLKAGAYGATLSGKGMGGIVVALAPDEKAGEIIKSVQRLKKVAFKVSVDFEGVKDEII